MTEETKKDFKEPENEVAKPIEEKTTSQTSQEQQETTQAPEPVAEKKDQKPQGQRQGRASSRSFKPQKREESEFVERVVKISRVSKVVKGGKNFSFSAMVVVGDGKGTVGIGHGKSNEVAESIKKGTINAKRNFVKITLEGDTIPHDIIGKFKASSVIMKPAGPGTGVIAGGAVRAVCDAVGIKNILTKSLGSRNSGNVIKATLDGFQRLRLERRR